MLLRDFGIAVRSVWKNLALFGALLMATAALLHLAYPEAGALGRLVDAFHLATIERVVSEQDSPLALVLTFVVPLLGVVILGEGALRVLSVFMARGDHREEWDRMVAKTLKNHIVICGVGELGRALILQLVGTNPDAAIVLVDPRASALAEVGLQNRSLTHIAGDMTSMDVLHAANCQQARMIILCSGNDAFNMESAFKVLQLNPGAEVWVRLYRAQLAELLDLEKRPNLHFFCPYQEAAKVLGQRLQQSAS